MLSKIRLAIIGISIITSVVGCTSMKEMTKGFLGVSTKVLEEGRAGAIKKTYGMGIKECKGKVDNALHAMGSYIYARDDAKGMIAFYVSCADTASDISVSDTTPVGVFFSAGGDAHTSVEIDSPSTYAKEFMAENIFDYLEGKVTLEQLKGRMHEKKDTAKLK